jgi:hypothetical protein
MKPRDVEKTGNRLSSLPIKRTGASPPENAPEVNREMLVEQMQTRGIPGVFRDRHLGGDDKCSPQRLSMATKWLQAGIWRLAENTKVALTSGDGTFCVKLGI